MECSVCKTPTLTGYTHPKCLSISTIDGIFPSLIYKGVVKKIVYTFKYPPYLTDLQEIIVNLLYEGLIQKEAFFALPQKSSLLVPIPLAKKKLRKRGYNQALLLAQSLSKRLTIPVLDILERTRDTNTQVGLSKEERAHNLRNAFALKPQYQKEIKYIEQIFLIDDVTTSGATMNECASLLKRAGIRNVWGITLAHGE